VRARGTRSSAVAVAVAAALALTVPGRAQMEQRDRRLEGAAAQGSPLLGKWTSARCEAIDPAGGPYVKRAFRFTQERWSLTTVVFSDATCQRETLTVETDGSYVIEGASTAVAGAQDIVLEAASRRVTARTPESAAALEHAGCGTGPWRVDVLRDVAIPQPGCGALTPGGGVCRQTYDLFRVQGNTLWFGLRTPPACVREDRPTALAPFPLVKLQ
jgi:Adenomatosis polyposis coli down-regulated 1